MRTATSAPACTSSRRCRAPPPAGVAVTPVPLMVNVYIEPTWRRRGLARALMTTLMQRAKEQGFDRVNLHASKDGHALYVALGFVPTNEMRWRPRCAKEALRELLAKAAAAANLLN
jgi:GNAT superfamily N-acetyltransferase